jgi:hypothetical protein
MMHRYRIHDTDVLHAQPFALFVLTKLISILSEIEHSNETVSSGTFKCSMDKEEVLLGTLHSLGLRTEKLQG